MKLVRRRIMKFLKKLLIATLGLAMAVGVGITAYQVGAVKTDATSESVWDFTTKAVKNANYTDEWNYGDVKIYGAANNNAGWAYIRVGGKSTATVKTSTLTSLSASVVDIASVTIQSKNVASGGSFTMDSVELTVSNSSDFAVATDTVTGVEVSTNMVFVPSSGTSWASGSYFKLSFNWSSTTTSNRGMDVEKVIFKENTSTVTDWVLRSIETVSAPTKTAYYTDDTVVDYTGAVIQANYYSESDPSTTRTSTLNNADIAWELDLQNNQVIATYGGFSLTYDITSSERPLMYSWDLTAASFSSSSPDAVTWTSNYVEMVWSKGTSSTAANNYLGGEHANSRIYNKQVCSFSAVEGYAISKIIFTLDTTDNSGLTGDWITDSGESIVANKSTESGVTLTIDVPSSCLSLTYTCTATTRVLGVEAQYVTREIVTPTMAEVSFASGKGSYFNGTLKSNNTFSTSDVVVRTKDDEGNVGTVYNGGTGFTLTVNGETLDATTEVKTLSFEGVAAGNYPIVATVDGFTTTNELNLVVVQKDVESFNWDKAQTTTFYSHVEKLTLDGTLRTTFNDGSYVTSSSNYDYVVREYNASLPNNAGDEVILQTHADGTLNVAEATTYVLDIWNNNYPSSLHTYEVINVALPTLTITDNFTGSYFTGVTRTLDVTVTLSWGDYVRTLTNEEYMLSMETVTPSDETPINVYPSLIVDDKVVMRGTTPLVITPVVSTRTLTGLAISNLEYSAGSYFVVPNEGILLEYDAGQLEYINQVDVEFVTASGAIIDANTRLLKSHAGTVTATYSEGSGDNQTVTTTFELTVTDAVVEAYSAPTVSEIAQKTTSIAVGDVVYLVCESKTAELSVLPGDKTYGISATYTDTISKTIPLEIVAGSVDGSFAFLTSESTYLSLNSSGNALHTRSTLDDNSSWTISFDDNGNAIITSCAYNTRTLQFNAGSPRFACYESSQTPVQLYKCDVTPGVGDPVSYLKSVIDAYRLNNASEALSICDATSGLYATEDWAKAKDVYASLSQTQKEELNVQDYFGEAGKTYVDTYEMLLANETNTTGANSLLEQFSSKNSRELLIVVAFISITIMGIAIFKRKNKTFEQ